MDAQVSSWLVAVMRSLALVGVVVAGGFVIGILPFVIYGLFDIVEYKYGEDTPEGIGLYLVAVCIRGLAIQVTVALSFPTMSYRDRPRLRFIVLDGALTFATLLAWILIVGQKGEWQIRPTLAEAMAMLSAGAAIGLVARLGLGRTNIKVGA